MSGSRLESFRTMVAKAPNNALARYGLANELVKAGLYEEAIASIDEYLAMHDDEGSVYRLLAQCYAGLGRTEEAKAAYRRGIDAATRHGHPSMAEEFSMKLEDLEDV